MPEKIIVKLDDGKEEEREYFTKEDLEKSVGETKAEFETKIKEMEGDLNPNWKEARKVMSEQQKKIAALESTGKTIDDKGQIVDLKPEISLDDVGKRAEEAAIRAHMNIKKEEYLSQYDEETRKVVEHNYNKLTAGEQITVTNMGQFIEQAEMLSTPNRGNVIRNAVTSIRGVAPSKAQPVDFADTDNGQSLGEQMGLRYFNKK